MLHVIFACDQLHLAVGTSYLHAWNLLQSFLFRNLQDKTSYIQICKQDGFMNAIKLQKILILLLLVL